MSKPVTPDTGSAQFRLGRLTAATDQVRALVRHAARTGRTAIGAVAAPGER